MKRRRSRDLPDPERVGALAGALHRRGWSNNPTNGTSLYARTTMGKTRDGRRVRVSMLDLRGRVLHVEAPLPGGFGGQVIGLVAILGDPEEEAARIDQIADLYLTSTSNQPEPT